MKFVSLALSLLLAVGSQARAVQSDAPSQLEHIKAAATVYLTRVKETAEKTLEHLDGTQYAEYNTGHIAVPPPPLLNSHSPPRLKLSESFDRLHEYTQTASQTLTPYGDAFTAQFLEATKQAREKVMADVEDLRTRLEPKREELRQVLQKHIDEYREKLDPVLQEYISKNQGDMEALRVKLQPLVEEMRAKVQVNVEETKSKLLPIVEVVRTKLTENLEELKNMASPYAAEYKEHLVKAVDDVKKNVSPHTADLQSKLEPYFEDLKSKFMALYETVAKKV
uniref:Apolipoprotein A-I n=1 Tax=Esox lucius TaxID=8010 RepID=A0AAY5L3Z8_ESOLU